MRQRADKMNPIALFERLRNGGDGSEQAVNSSESTMKLAQTVSQLQQETIQQTNTLSELEHKISQLERENQKLTHIAKNSALSSTTSPILMTSSIGGRQTGKISLDSIISKYATETVKGSRIPRTVAQLTDSSLEKKITVEEQNSTPEKEQEDEKPKPQQTPMQENMEFLTGKSIVHLDAQETLHSGEAELGAETGQADEQMANEMAQQYPGAFLADDGQWYYYPQDQYAQPPEYSYAPQYQQYSQYPQYSEYPQYPQYAADMADAYAQYPQQPEYADYGGPQLQSQLLLTQPPDQAYEQYMQEYQLMQQQMEQFSIMEDDAQPEPEVPSVVEKSQHSPSKTKPKAQSYPRKKGIVEQKDPKGIPVFKVNVDDVKATGDRVVGGAQAGRIKNGVYVERIRLD